VYAGEHTAGTEFMIGPLFIDWGATANGLIFGLLLGSLFAVLNWRYLTAHIATAQRLTLYFKMEKIAGRRLVFGYNLATRLFLDRKFPSWGYEVANGANSVGERWDSYTAEHGFNGANGKQNAAMNSFRSMRCWRTTLIRRLRCMVTT